MPDVLPGRIFGLAPVQVTGSAPTTIDGLSSLQINNGLNRIVHSADGEVDPKFSTTAFNEPRIRFRTCALKTVLDLAILGRSIPDSTIITALNFFFRQRAPGSTYQPASLAHCKFALTKGILIPVQLRGTHPNIVECECEGVAVSDAGNAPLSFDAGQTLPNFTPVADVGALWTVGPVYINGELLENIFDITVDFGIELELMQGSGFPWPTQVSIKSRMPKITLTTKNIEALDKDAAALAIAAVGQPQSGVCSVFFRKKLQGGANVPDGTTGHIKIKLFQCDITWTDVAGQHPESPTATIVITPTKDDDINEILAINTSTIINDT